MDCKWKKESCVNCSDSDPLTTQNYCHMAVKIFLASEKVLCPNCHNGYMKLNEEHSFECPSCNCKLDYEKVI